MPYLGKQSEQVGVSIQKYEFLQATDTSSGTTSFSVPSDAGDHVNVWLNGVLLVEGASNDYTTTSTTVVFGSAPADGDIIRIDVVESFSLPDALKSSGDTMTGPLKLDGGLTQQTSQALSGTYAYHQMMVSDAFTVAGDVTISDNLVLTKISDDSNAITLTDDGSTRTITGTGSLETSTIAQTPNSSLTGMTGELGSAVTFPAGHILQVQETIYTNLNTLTSVTSGSNTGINVSITPRISGSKITVRVHLTYGVNIATGVGMIIKRTGPSSTDLQVGSGGTNNWGTAQYHTNSTWTSEVANMHALFTDTAQDNTTSHTYTVWVAANNSSTIKINGRTDGDLWAGTYSIQVMEIAG